MGKKEMIFVTSVKYVQAAQGHVSIAVSALTAQVAVELLDIVRRAHSGTLISRFFIQQNLEKSEIFNDSYCNKRLRKGRLK